MPNIKMKKMAKELDWKGSKLGFSISNNGSKNWDKADAEALEFAAAFFKDCEAALKQMRDEVLAVPKVEISG